MNENQIVTNKNENTHMAANIFKDSFSKTEWERSVDWSGNY